jgi:hypothetical protein
VSNSECSFEPASDAPATPEAFCDLRCKVTGDKIFFPSQSSKPNAARVPTGPTEVIECLAAAHALKRSRRSQKRHAIELTLPSRGGPGAEVAALASFS